MIVFLNVWTCVCVVSAQLLAFYWVEIVNHPVKVASSIESDGNDYLKLHDTYLTALFGCNLKK